MENLVFTTFADEKNATEGLRKIQELDQIGDITVYNIALIEKSSDNTLVIRHHEGPDFASLPAEGAIVGSIIGLLAGPIGMAIGMLSGTVFGAANEDESMQVSQQFIDKAGKQLLTGEFALVMDVEEYATVVINSYMTSVQRAT